LDKAGKKKFSVDKEDDDEFYNRERNCLDLMAFGRFTASNDKLSNDGYVYMAHAFTINRSHGESDFFTVMSDLRPSGQNGFANGKCIDITSGIYYFSFVFRLRDFVKDAKERKFEDEDIAKYIEMFFRHFLLSFPTGKQNSMMSNTVPLYFYVAKSGMKQPMTMASAFETPVRNIDEGIRALKEAVDQRQDIQPDYEFMDNKSNSVAKMMDWILGNYGEE
jgi:CRISPR system Cascade subunit CasC